VTFTCPDDSDPLVVPLPPVVLTGDEVLQAFVRILRESLQSALGPLQGFARLADISIDFRDPEELLPKRRPKRSCASPAWWPPQAATRRPCPGRQAV